MGNMPLYIHYVALHIPGCHKNREYNLYLQECNGISKFSLFESTVSLFQLQNKSEMPFFHGEFTLQRLLML